MPAAVAGRGRRRARVIPLGLMLCALAVAPARTEPAARELQRIDEAARAALDDALQPELPRYAGDGSGSARARRWDPSRRGDQPFELPADRRRLDAETTGPLGPLGTLLNLLLWGLLVVGSVLVAFWLSSELVRYGGADAALAADDPEGAAPVDLAVIERPLGDAEELAARGDYADAIHTLLLRTLVELVRSSAVRVGPALTSREILARVPLQADAREALAGLITAVEVTHFGDDVATVADYHRCRDQFQRFATAFRGAAPRAVDRRPEARA